MAVGLVERNSAPLALVVEPGSRLRLRLVYMANRFEDVTVDRMLENLCRILVDLTTESTATLSSISYQTELSANH